MLSFGLVLGLNIMSEFITPVAVGAVSSIIVYFLTERKSFKVGKKQLIDFRVKFLRVIEYIDRYENENIKLKHYFNLNQKAVFGDISEFEDEINLGWSEANVIEHCKDMMQKCEKNMKEIEKNISVVENELKVLEVGKVKEAFYKEIKKIAENGIKYEKLKDYREFYKKINK